MWPCSNVPVGGSRAPSDKKKENSLWYIAYKWIKYTFYVKIYFYIKIKVFQRKHLRQRVILVTHCERKAFFQIMSECCSVLGHKVAFVPFAVMAKAAVVCYLAVRHTLPFLSWVCSPSKERHLHGPEPVERSQTQTFILEHKWRAVFVLVEFKSALHDTPLPFYI